MASGGLLIAAQRAGAVRPDVTVAEVKALLVGCQAMQGYNADVAERVTDVAFDGLRAGVASAEWGGEPVNSQTLASRRLSVDPCAGEHFG